MKQVLTIPEIKEGILFQGKTVGIREAYNLFCDEQEAAVWMVSQLAQGNLIRKIRPGNPCRIYCCKSGNFIVCNETSCGKTIVLETEYLKEEKTNENNKIAILVDSGTDVPEELIKNTRCI